MSEPKPKSKAAIRAAVEMELEGVPDRSGKPPAIPDHELLRRIGGGAYGDVWLARNALGTLRAVKIVYRARFEDEHPYQREFNGILKYEPISRTHEGLVAVLHAGRNDEAGCFYYVMELADEGGHPGGGANANGTERAGAAQAASSILDPGSYKPRTLRSELAGRQRLPATEAAQLVIRLASALGHLHAHGLVHRDIKPGNVIFVGGQPKLADIGLVTAVGDSRSFVGTEGFIPPEGPGTAQADLYGLGKLLYELATGRDRMDFPQLPAGLGGSPDGEGLLELNEVMTRACAPEPSERYVNAAEMQAELNLFLAGRSLRQARQTERHLVWLKRFALAVCIVLFLAVAAIGFAKSAEREARQREQRSLEQARSEASLRHRAEAAELEQSALRAEAQQARSNEARLRIEAQAQELAARKKAYASDMNLLRQALAADDLGRAQDLLNRQRPGPGEPDMRGWEWRYHWQFCQSDAAYTLGQRSNSIISVSFSADGGLLAAGTMNGEVTVWDLATREIIFQKAETLGGPGRLAFAPRNGILAYCEGNTNRSLVLWDGGTRKEVNRLPLKGAIRDLAFARDGRLFTAEVSASNNITVWDIASGTVSNRFTAGFPDYGMGMVFGVAPDGGRFAHAISGAAHSVSIVGAEGGWQRRVRVTEELTTALAFSLDGRILATGAGYADGVIKLWDVDTGEFIAPLEGHRSWVSSLKLLRDGKTLASASADRTIRLWDLAARRPLRTLRGHSGELWTMDVSPDSRWLASGGKDGSIMLWDLASSTNRPPTLRTLQPSGTEFWAYSADGRWIGAIYQACLRFYDAATLQPARQPISGLTNVFSFAFSPDMSLLVTTDAARHLAVWDLPGQRQITNFVAHLPPAGGCDPFFLAGGKSVLTIGRDNLAREWDVATWKETRRWPISPSHTATAACTAAGLLATASRDNNFELISLTQPERRSQFVGQSHVPCIELSADGKILAGASENGTVEIWDTQTLKRVALLHGVLLGYHSVAISPDGERLAAGSNGQEAIKLWDLHSHEEVATLPAEGSLFKYVAFSPDGNTIGAQNWKGVVHFWTAPTWMEIEAAEGARVPRAGR